MYMSINAAILLYSTLFCHNIICYEVVHVHV